MSALIALHRKHNLSVWQNLPRGELEQRTEGCEPRRYLTASPVNDMLFTPAMEQPYPSTAHAKGSTHEDGGDDDTSTSSNGISVAVLLRIQGKGWKIIIPMSPSARSPTKLFCPSPYSCASTNCLQRDRPRGTHPQPKLSFIHLLRRQCSRDCQRHDAPPPKQLYGHPGCCGTSTNTIFL